MRVLPGVRWGFIGCGQVTERKSGPAFAKISGSRVAAVMGRDLSRTRDYARRHNIPLLFTDVEDLIQEPTVDAVYIATPHSLHKPFALMAARAGKPVYVEKPMATSYPDALEMADAFEMAGLPLYVAYYRRMLPAFIFCRELVANGKLGNITKVEMLYQRPPRQADLNPSGLPWRLQPGLSGGGYLFDIGPHHLDFMAYLFEDIKLMEAVHCNRAGLYPPEDFTHALFILDGRIPFSATWDFASTENQPVDVFRIEGDRGRVQFPFFGPYGVELDIGGQHYRLGFPDLMHVQQPLIETIVSELTGRGARCPSTGRTALEASRLIDEITGITQC